MRTGHRFDLRVVGVAAIVTRRSNRPRMAIAVVMLLGVAFAVLGVAPVAATGRSAAIVDTASYSFAFSPSTLKVNVGDRVTWTNLSMAPHNVTFATFRSPSEMGTGSTYGHTFTTAGTFIYQCTIHGFTGKVVVLGTAATATPKPTPKPTPRPTPKPTLTLAPRVSSEPTASPEPSTVSTAASESSTAASSSPGIGAPVITSAGGSPVPASDVNGGATGPLIALLAGVVIIGAMVVGTAVRRRR